MRSILFLALLALPAFAQAPAADYKVGDRVDILFGEWYPGTVLKVGDKQWFVHYDNYADSWDSWMPAEKLRPSAAGAAPVKPKEPPPPKNGDPAVKDPGPAVNPGVGNPAVGEMCEASWNNSWYEIKILEIADGKFKVRWWETATEEWLPRDRIRRKGEEKEVLPRKGREGNGGGLPMDQMIGKEVEVFWHGQWWRSKVTRTEGKRFLIQYLTGTAAGGTREEWVVAERVREIGGAAYIQVDPKTVPGKKGLSGLWYRYRQVEIGKVIREHFLFFEDGFVFNAWPGLPLKDFNVAAFRVAYPGNCGGYGIQGDRINWAFGGDADDVEPWTFERLDDNTMKLNGMTTFRALSFEDGERLDGVYSDPTGNQSTKWTFHADGTYQYDRILNMAARDIRGVALAHDVKEEHSSGKYRFSGQTIETTDDKGVVFKELAYPCWKKGEAKELVIIWGTELRHR